MRPYPKRRRRTRLGRLCASAELVRWLGISNRILGDAERMGPSRWRKVVRADRLMARLLESKIVRIHPSEVLERSKVL